MYGNQVMGEYTTHEAALAAKAEFKGDTFEEFFIEIEPINDNDPSSVKEKEERSVGAEEEWWPSDHFGVLLTLVAGNALKGTGCGQGLLRASAVAPTAYLQNLRERLSF